MNTLATLHQFAMEKRGTPDFELSAGIFLGAYTMHLSLGGESSPEYDAFNSEVARHQKHKRQVNAVTEDLECLIHYRSMEADIDMVPSIVGEKLCNILLGIPD